MARRRKKLDYISAAEDIRAIANGRNAAHRTMTWREAVERWEAAHGADEYGRAALFVYLGIATTDECKLLDALEGAGMDTPEEESE